LITKGTLTGVVDRLAAKSLVRRVASASDGRSQIVQLTRAGEKMFDKVFPAHLGHLEQVFASFSQKDFNNAKATLKQLKEAFTSASGNVGGAA
jgi:DNA-binding MarR family transcriptional regulator